MSIMIASGYLDSQDKSNSQTSLPLANPMPCSDRATLQAYLSGSSNIDLASLEQHLQDCSTCKDLIRELEQEPDSMAGFLKGQSLETLLHPSETQRSFEPREPGGSLDAPLNPLPNTFGSYQIIDSLGRGGMGTVFLAMHRTLQKKVAIKILPSGMLSSPEALSRFERETMAAGQLDHPSIVRATDAGETSGYRYLAMEYVRGQDLSRITRTLGPLPIADACELIRQAALGLSHAHLQGMVHRDIKPSNLMLDETGQLKILDFGLVQCDRWESPQQELTTVGQLMGTLDYMAPEQAERSTGVDHRADLYALGATLFRLLTGRAPLVATPNQSPLEKLRLLIRHQPPSLALFRPEAPAELIAFVDQLLSTLPTDRPPSAALVAQALAPFARGARPDRTHEESQNQRTRTRRRNTLHRHPTFLESH